MGDGEIGVFLMAMAVSLGLAVLVDASFLGSAAIGAVFGSLAFWVTS